MTAIFTPSSLLASSVIVDKAVHETRTVTLESALMLCEDIASFDGTAADCVLALKTFKRRLEEMYP